MIVVCKIVMKNIVFALMSKARASKRSSVHANLSVGNKCFMFSVVGMGEMPNFSAQTHSKFPINTTFSFTNIHSEQSGSRGRQSLEA